MDNKALVVIDFINDIVHPDGKIASSAAFIKKHQVIEHANTAIAAAREQKMLILFVKVGFSSTYLECPPTSPLFSRAKEFKALQLNSWGTAFYDTLNVEPTDPVIIKHRVSAFYATDLEAFLHAQTIQKLYLCGVSTDMAIQTTAREAHDRDYQVVIIKDACGAMTDKLHEDTIQSLERIAKISTATALFK